MALSMASGILTQIGMGKLGRPGLEPAQRYERERPGELIHIDVKKLGRTHNGAGHRVTGKRGRYTGSRTDAEGRPSPDRRMGVRTQVAAQVREAMLLMCAAGFPTSALRCPRFLTVTGRSA